MRLNLAYNGIGKSLLIIAASILYDTILATMLNTKSNILVNTQIKNDAIAYRYFQNVKCMIEPKTLSIQYWLGAIVSDSNKS